MPPLTPLPETLLPGESVGHAKHHEALHKKYNADLGKTYVEQGDIKTATSGTSVGTPRTNLIVNPKLDKLITTTTNNFIGFRSVYLASGNTGSFVKDTTAPNGCYYAFKWGGQDAGRQYAAYFTTTSTSVGPITPNATCLSVAPGDTYTITAIARSTCANAGGGSNTNFPTIEFRYAWFKSDGTRIGVFGQIQGFLTKDWKTYRFTTPVAPADAAYLSLTFDSTFGSMVNATSGDESHYAAVTIEKNVSTPPPYYFDGDTPGAKWNGTKNASTSTITNLSRQEAGEFMTQGYTNMVLVPHGSVATVARPLGLPAGAVYWVGTVTPTNADPLDIKRISGTLS